VGTHVAEAIIVTINEEAEELAEGDGTVRLVDGGSTHSFLSPTVLPHNTSFIVFRRER
jgi:hypothetical protein